MAMHDRGDRPITDVIGAIPYRMALAGGWIDQPFVSRRNPSPPGSMVVVAVEPDFWWMERAGMATGTRKVASRLWRGKLPAGNPDTDRPSRLAELVRHLYAEENRDREEPSGSQDMVGLIYPGINRLDFDAEREGGIFPCHIASCNDPQIARWLQQVLHVLPVMQRPPGYGPLGVKNLDSQWIGRLGQTGKDCYDAILGHDMARLGASMNECMACWETILPHTVKHETIDVDLVSLLKYYQARYPGAMYSGCGGGYLYVVSDEPVPGSFRVRIRLAKEVA